MKLKTEDYYKLITFTNQASLSYNNTVTNSNVTTGQIIEVLSISKTSLQTTYSADDTVTFIISIVNSGNTPFTNITINDNLAGYTVGNGSAYPLSYVENSVRYFVNGVMQSAPAVSTAVALVISGINIPAGGNAVVVYEARITKYAPLEANSTITNAATIEGAGITTLISASETLNIEEEPQLTISKSLSPTTVSENGQITYTFVIQNYGNTAADADDNAIISDIFSPILGNITVQFNSATWAPTENYTYSEETGAFATVAGQVTVPAATFTQNAQTGEVSVEPGVSVLTVTGTLK